MLKNDDGSIAISQVSSDFINTSDFTISGERTVRETYTV